MNKKIIWGLLLGALTGILLVLVSIISGNPFFPLLFFGTIRNIVCLAFCIIGIIVIPVTFFFALSRDYKYRQMYYSISKVTPYKYKMNIFTPELKGNLDGYEFRYRVQDYGSIIPTYVPVITVKTTLTKFLLKPDWSDIKIKNTIVKIGCVKKIDIHSENSFSIKLLIKPLHQDEILHTINSSIELAKLFSAHSIP